MSLERAFLDDIIAHPDDDAPRLVMADWLDEQGEAARAEFIRLQVRLARLPEAQSAERPALQAREAELLERHHANWSEPLRPLVYQYAYTRGFIEFAELNGDHGHSLGNLPTIFAQAPVRKLSVHCFNADTAELLVYPELLTRVCYLDLFELDEMTASHLRKLFTSPGLANLETLYIDQEYLDDFPVSALAALGNSPALSRLVELGLAIGDQHDLPTAVVRSIARSAYLRLKTLYLFFARVSRVLARDIATSAALAGLTGFTLESSEVEPAAWGELLRPTAFPNLTRLVIQRVEMTEAVRQRLRDRFGDRVVFDQESDDFFPRVHGFSA